MAEHKQLIESLVKTWRDQLGLLQPTAIVDAWPSSIWHALIATKPISWLLEQIDYLSDLVQRIRIYSLIWPKLTPDQQASLTVQLGHIIASIDALGTRITAIGVIHASLPQQCLIWLNQTLDAFESAGKLQHQTDCLNQIICLKLDRDLYRGVIERVHSLLLQLPPNHSTQQSVRNLINYYVTYADFEQARQLAELLEQAYRSPYGWNVISKAWLAGGNSVQQLVVWRANEAQMPNSIWVITGLLEAQRLSEALIWLAQYPQLNDHESIKSHLINAYLAHQELAEAAAIAITIPQPWVYSHPIEDVIKAYVICGDSEQALVLARSIDSPWQQIRGLVTIFINDSRLELAQFDALFAEAYAHVARLDYPILQAWSLFDLARSSRLVSESQFLALIAETLEVAKHVDDSDDYEKLILQVCRCLIMRQQLELAETTLFALGEIELTVNEQLSGLLTQAYLDAGRLNDAMRLAVRLNNRPPWQCLIHYYSEHDQLDLALELSKNLCNDSRSEIIYQLVRVLTQVQQPALALLITHHSRTPLEQCTNDLLIATSLRSDPAFNFQALLTTIEQRLAMVPHSEQRIAQQIALSIEFGLLDLEAGLAKLATIQSDWDEFEIVMAKAQILLHHGHFAEAKQLLTEVASYDRYFLILMIIQFLTEQGLLADALALVAESRNPDHQIGYYACIAASTPEPKHAKSMINRAVELLSTTDHALNSIDSLALTACNHGWYELAWDLSEQISDLNQQGLLQTYIFNHQAIPNQALAKAVAIKQTYFRVQALVAIAHHYPLEVYCEFIQSQWIQATTITEFVQLLGLIEPVLKQHPQVARELFATYSLVSCAELG
ncbi:hypothetical protein [Herpetosiphon sp. NSE202]|uniref:hypothetical protein n=1 Tax=Herpetosiphon sp. NSE202 TaxID=3351349 RepID=UPI00363A3C0D